MGHLVYLKDVVTLRLYREKCVGCGMCTVVCPHAVFGMDNGHAFIQARDACMECGACERNCPVAAVTVQAGVGCAAAVINRALGRSGSPDCCSLEPGSAGNQETTERSRCC